MKHQVIRIGNFYHHFFTYPTHVEYLRSIYKSAPTQ